MARRALAECEGLRQEAQATRGDPAGTLRIGAIPTTLPIVSLMTEGCLRDFPRMLQAVHTLSAGEVVRRLTDFEIDVGLSYLHDDRLKGFDTLPLYRERYVLVARDEAMFEGRTEIGWKEAARLPLCLLTRNMQSRRGIDVAFANAGLEATPRVETDSVMALHSYVRCANLFGILPHGVLCLLEMRQELTAIRMVPELTREIGLIHLHRDPLPALQSAAMSSFARVDLQTRMDALLAGID